MLSVAVPLGQTSPPWAGSHQAPLAPPSPSSDSRVQALLQARSPQFRSRQPQRAIPEVPSAPTCYPGGPISPGVRSRGSHQPQRALPGVPSAPGVRSRARCEITAHRRAARGRPGLPPGQRWAVAGRTVAPPCRAFRRSARLCPAAAPPAPATPLPGRSASSSAGTATPGQGCKFPNHFKLHLRCLPKPALPRGRSILTLPTRLHLSPRSALQRGSAVRLRSHRCRPTPTATTSAEPGRDPRLSQHPPSVQATQLPGLGRSAPAFAAIFPSPRGGWVPSPSCQTNPEKNMFDCIKVQTSTCLCPRAEAL